MSTDPGPDPGGASQLKSPDQRQSSSQEFSDLKDQFEQQQVLIAQLKEMLRKSEQTNVTQEKVDEYMNTLTKMSARAKKGKGKRDDSNVKTIDTPAKEKINLLRQQLEENKAKLAARGKSQKGIEEMVIQLKAQLDDSQQLIGFSGSQSIVETKLDYNINSSSEELFNILLSKERRITELTAKVQKLETNVIDLQENVKEKDSVIDARTKAITLMTENLSKKGKSTLDSLEETKEQMRKMQENFVQMETEMKARQMKLLDDLRLKNYEIAELQELNNNLKEENSKLINSGSKDLEEPVQTGFDFDNTKVQELEGLLNEIKINNADLKQQLDSLQIENEKLLTSISENQNTIKTLNTELDRVKSSDTDEEIVKLKKQLDESNKAMIKVKAQNKSKVKELTKKIDQFKKVSDAHAEIVKLKEENCQLQQKILDLEEEKGSLQLKIVETEPGKDVESDAEQMYKITLEEKEKVIEFLEAEIVKLKSENHDLNDKLNSISQMRNAQVTSEITSIHLEEQMDSLENQNKQLHVENGELEKEKTELLEKIETLKKEKQELSAKLEQYIQENIELIDKLEKLSAEKVSSAESIEIVEGLTQQEKIELEAYQKKIDLASGNLKSSEENLPQTVDLNESVNEVNEEAAELLQKIELFTEERREVMEKMEDLKQENNYLNLKIREIENNRDILTETYEQLQNEKENLDTKYNEVIRENNELKEKLLTENLNKNSEENQSLETELKELKNEIEEYKILIEEKNQAFYKLKDNLHSLEVEKEALTSNMLELQEDNSHLIERVKALNEVQVNLEELLQNNRDKLESINDQESETQRVLQVKESEIEKLLKEQDNFVNSITNLQAVIQEKDETLGKVSSDLKEKYLTLQRKLEENSSDLDHIRLPLEKKVEELTNKNKEQLEKMKKIAANLKKKTHEYQELESKFKDAQEQREIDDCDKKKKLENNESRIANLLQQNEELEAEITNLQSCINDRNNKIDGLTLELEELKLNRLELESKASDLQNIITELKEKTNDMNLEQELRQSNSDLCSNQPPVNDSSLQSKIQELELIVETQQSELQEYREKVNKLEEELSILEERRLNLEKTTADLGTQLEEKSLDFEEVSRSGGLLEERLSALTAHEELVEKKLLNFVQKNQELESQNESLIETNEKLTKKIEHIMEKVKDVNSYEHIVEELEATNCDYKKQIHNLETELRNLQTDYERVYKDYREELDKRDADWQTQFDEILKDKMELVVKVEKFEEENREILERATGLDTELSEYKSNLESSNAEIESYKLQINDLQKKSNLESSRREEVASNQFVSFFDSFQPSSDKLQLEQQQITIDLQNSQAALQASKQEIEQLKGRIFELEQELTRKVEPTLKVEPSSIFDSLTVVSDSNVQENKFQMEMEDLKRELQNSQADLVVSNQEISILRNTIYSLEHPIIETMDPSSFFDTLQSSTHIDSEQLKVQSEPGKMANELENTKLALLDANKEISRLQLVIKELEQEVVERTAKTAVESIMTEAQEKLDSPQHVSPVTCNEPSSYFTSQQPDNSSLNANANANILQELPLNNNAEELKNKIKTLEFMLFTTEKEKEDALLQCHQLTCEITQLLYENQNQKAGTSNVTSIEEQILQPSDIVDTDNTLKQLEFTETKPCLHSSIQEGPIKEEPIQSKEAYLCYPDPETVLEPPKPIFSIESQILSPSEIIETPEVVHELQKIEFEKTNPPKTSTQPIEESKAVEKHAYLCFDTDDNTVPCSEGATGLTITHDTFGENDDGWGWGPEEVRLEEEHAQRSNMEALQEKVRVLELERSNHLEEIKQLQIRSGKLVKKIKEMKVKYDQLKSSQSILNLDDTIQDELKLQIEQVEKKLKETCSELQKEKAEKINIKKRVDVLTSANERMVEMKEKQDIELLGWQQNCRDLNAKLAELEWGDDTGTTSTSEIDNSKPLSSPSRSNIDELTKKVNELNEVIKELTLDNEDLQTLLEEQRMLRLNAEKVKSVEPVNVNMKTETEYLEIVKERDTLNKNKKSLENKVNELIKTHDELLAKFNEIVSEKGELTNLISSKDDIIDSLNASVSNIEMERTKLSEQINLLENEKSEVLHNIKSNESNIVDSQHKIDVLSNEKEFILKELEVKDSEIYLLRQVMESEMSSLRMKLEQTMQEAQNLLGEKQELGNTLTEKTQEIEHLSREVELKNHEIVSAMDQVVKDWEQRVDQRGNEIADIWKLHLESREMEFSQVEQALKKEINELEEKCNALVNENNELRKNVDAEIRNEVDRVSALQQQINDRQHCVNELSTTVQEKQKEIERLLQEIGRINTELVELKSEMERKDVELSLEKQIVDGVIGRLQVSGLSISNRDLENILKAFEVNNEQTSMCKQELNEFKVKFEHEQESLLKTVSECNEYKYKLENLQTNHTILQNQLEEKQKQAVDLAYQLEQAQQQSGEYYQNLQQNLSEYQHVNTQINSQLQDLNVRYEELLSKYEEKDLETITMTEYVCTLENTTKEAKTEANELLKELDIYKQRLNENENHYEELLLLKNSDIENLQIQLKDQAEKIDSYINKTSEFDSISTQLISKIEECSQLEQKVFEQNQLLDEEHKQLTELKNVIEDQVLKIEELKSDLYKKSNDYDSLIAEIDISQINQNREAPSTSSSSSTSKPAEEDLSEPVCRAELDLALYLLHQRDVRCEELTVELTQLLEERDTLQLRLSNAIREKEELGRSLQGTSSEIGTIPKVTSEDSAEKSLVVEKDQLANKLSELKSVGYKKDKTIVDEQELRRLQELSILQQHRDVASKLPVEAAAKLVDASYTLSRDVQSPSKVLLNWLWGKSTPKVNNI